MLTEQELAEYERDFGVQPSTFAVELRLLADVRALRAELDAAKLALATATLPPYQMLPFSPATFNRFLRMHNAAVAAAITRIDVALGGGE